MIYFIQCTLYTAFLYLIYVLLLRHKALHAWNRAYLLGCVAIPPLLPFIAIHGIDTPVAIGAAYANLSEVDILRATGTGNAGAVYGPHLVLPTIYVLVSAMLLARFAWQYHRLQQITRRNGNARLIDDAYVLTGTGMGPGSFGKYIFFPGSDADDAILEHELAHVRRRHTWDMVLVRFMQCLFWPNIALVLVARELKMTHEFQADADSATDTTAYAGMLLGSTFGIKQYSFTHTFFHHPIKRRIAMLQNKTTRRGRLSPAMFRSALAALLVTTGVVYLQSCSRRAIPEPTVYAYVDQMPHAEYDLGTYLSSNIKYPEEARKKNIDGRVIVKFIVDENGEIRKPEAVKSPDPILTDEALRVVSAMPKWTPGMNKHERVPVYFTLPISFHLANSTNPDAQ